MEMAAILWKSVQSKRVKKMEETLKMMTEFREEARWLAKISADNPLPESATVYASSGKRKGKKVMSKLILE